MKRILSRSEYRFSPSDSKVIFAKGVGFDIHNVFIITNVVTNDIIYNFACDTYGGVVGENSITLMQDVSDMSSTDELMILIEDKDYEPKYITNIRDDLKQTNNLLKEINDGIKRLL